MVGVADVLVLEIGTVALADVDNELELEIGVDVGFDVIDETNVVVDSDCKSLAPSTPSWTAIPTLDFS